MCCHTPATPSDGSGLLLVRHMSETSRLFHSVSAAGAPSTQSHPRRTSSSPPLPVPPCCSHPDLDCNAKDFKGNKVSQG